MSLMWSLCVLPREGSTLVNYEQRYWTGDEGGEASAEWERR